MKTKTAEEILNKHVETYRQDFNYKDEILKAMEEYKNQFSQLPASVTDEDIEKMLFAKIGARETMTEKEYLIGCIMGKMVRDILNHPPVMGEGWEEDYWKQRCLLAEKCLEESPCDPDITPKQIAAWNNYHEFIKSHQANTSGR